MENWENSVYPGRGQLLIDDEDSPPAVGLVAENYRLKLTARLGSRIETDAPPVSHPLIPILIVECPYSPQLVRSVHFVPLANEVVPLNCHVFDFDSAMDEYNEKQYEYQQYLICEAMRRAGPRPSKPRMQSAPRTTPHISYERQPQKFTTAGITLPTKRAAPPRKKAAPGKPPIGESITISRVAVPDQKRPRPNRQLARDVIAPQRSARVEVTRVDGNRADTGRADGRATPRRYKSPPPKPPERARGGTPVVRCARGDYSSQVQQLGDRMGDCE
jgi:hypothetical protein